MFRIFFSFLSFFLFYLVLPFYFLKWNHYFSACEDLSNFSCHFWKHKSVFLQILQQSSVPYKLTRLYLFSSNIIYFVQKEPLKCIFLRLLSCAWVKICQIPHDNFETTKSSSNFASFFTVLIHKSSVNFKIIHFF